MNETPVSQFPHSNLNLAADIKAAQEVTDIMPDAIDAATRAMEQWHTDSKTGLMSEKLWKNSLQDTIEQSGPDDQVRVWVADLDGFKAVNDELTHSGGDELLGIVGQAFRDTFLRSTDKVGHGSRDSGSKEDIARLGGDEFGVLTVRSANEENHDRQSSLEEETLVQAKRVNQRLGELLKGTKFEKFGVKLSIGSAELQSGEELESVFARADLEMYTAKYEGKISRLTPDDVERLQVIIPYLESKGARVEQWLKIGSGLIKAA